MLDNDTKKLTKSELESTGKSAEWIASGTSYRAKHINVKISKSKHDTFVRNPSLQKRHFTDEIPWLVCIKSKVNCNTWKVYF